MTFDGWNIWAALAYLHQLVGLDISMFPRPELVPAVDGSTAMPATWGPATILAPQFAAIADKQPYFLPFGAGLGGVAVPVAADISHAIDLFWDGQFIRGPYLPSQTLPPPFAGYSPSIHIGATPVPLNPSNLKDRGGAFPSPSPDPPAGQLGWFGPCDFCGQPGECTELKAAGKHICAACEWKPNP